MKDKQSIASLLIFVGTALCFFLPFVTVSCGGIKAFTLTGQQLATGTTLTQPQAFGPPQSQKVDGDPFAAIAGLCALAGIVLSLIGKRMAGASAAAGGAGAVSLLIMRSRLDAQIQKQSQGLATMTYETGFTLVLLLLFAAVAWNLYLLLQNQRLRTVEVPDGDGRQDSVGSIADSRGSPPQRIEAVEPLPQPVPSAAFMDPASQNREAHTRFCAQCGQKVKLNARFCESCGRPTEIATQAIPSQPLN